MEYYITYEDEQVIRIEDEDGCSVSIGVISTDFYILSIMVDEKLRLQGRGRGLIAAAEHEAYARKKSQMCVVYVDDESISPFIKKCGFRTTDVSLLTAFDVKNMLKIKRVRQMISRVPDDHRYRDLRSLDIDGFEEIIRFLADKRLSSVAKRVSDMDLDTSGVLMVRGVMTAVILCVRIGDDLYLDSAASSEEADKMVIASAFTGMIEAAFSSGIRYLVTSQPEGLVKTVIEFITDGYTGEESGKWVYSIKIPEKPKNGDEEISIHRDIQPELKNEWQRELRHFPMQRSMSESTLAK